MCSLSGFWRHCTSCSVSVLQTQTARRERPAPEPASEYANQEFEGVVLWVYINAMKNYRCHPVDTRAILFRSQDSVPTARAIDASQGWDGLFTRGLEIVDVPGDHDSGFHYSLLTS